MRYGYKHPKDGDGIQVRLWIDGSSCIIMLDVVCPVICDVVSDAVFKGVVCTHGDSMLSSRNSAYCIRNPEAQEREWVRPKLRARRREQRERRRE